MAEQREQPKAGGSYRRVGGTLELVERTSPGPEAGLTGEAKAASPKAKGQKE